MSALHDVPAVGGGRLQLHELKGVSSHVIISEPTYSERLDTLADVDKSEPLLLWEDSPRRKNGV